MTRRGLGEVAGLGYDGRGDVVWFAGDSSSALLDLRTSEDVFAQVTSVKAGDFSADRLASALLDLTALDKALSVRATLVAPLRGKMSARAIVRTLSEDRFLRTELRDAAARRLGGLKPRWISADPSDVELWVLEALPGLFKCGVRLSSGQMRQHGGRAVERPGALRPTVAAAMVSLAGEPSRMPLLDPFCGSGTILAEGIAAGWSVLGADADPEAIRVAQANTPGADVFVGDARKIDRLPDAVLQSMVRVTAPRGRIILLVPRSDAMERSISRNHDLGLRDSIPMRLLGTPTTIWSLQKT